MHVGPEHQLLRDTASCFSVLTTRASASPCGPLRDGPVALLQHLCELLDLIIVLQVLLQLHNFP